MMRSDFADERRTDAPHWAERLVRFLDDGIVVPGTGYRIGVDGLLGMLVPVLGDATTAAGSLSLFWLAVQRGVPRSVLARMALNVGLDALIGSVPVVGDLFDFVWKANRRNLSLIERATRQPQYKPKVFDYVLLAGFVLFVTIAVALPFVVTGYLIAKVLD
ncbi:MAG: hypothetical protein RLZZ450_7373 [Pseudomonadota bacterium]|jgi:hypothetical protein